MKKAIALLSVILFCSCNTSQKTKAKNVQFCLDYLHQHNEDRFLLHSKIILVKDAQSAGLENLHFGNNQIQLKEVPASAIVVYYLPEQDTRIRYLKLKYSQVNNDNITVVIALPNTNAWHTLYLKKEDSNWKIVRTNWEVD